MFFQLFTMQGSYREVLKTEGEARGFQHFQHIYMVPYLIFLNHSKRSVVNNPFSQNSMYKCIFHGFPCRMIWKMHGCTRKSMDICVKVSVYTDVHGKSKHSTRKSMESLDIGKN